MAKSDRKISICTPTYQRTDMLFESNENVIGDDRISEIVIVDDASEEGIWKQIEEHYAGIDKVKLFRNPENLDCYRNKHRSVELATNEYVCIWDSDNKFQRDYIDRLYEHEWQPTVSLCPDWGYDVLDYRKFSGKIFSKETVSEFAVQLVFGSCINTFNHFIHRQEYLHTWNFDINPLGADSIYFNYLWMLRGNKMHIVDGLRYTHVMHPQSHHAGVGQQSRPISKMLEERMKNGEWNNTFVI